MSLALLQRPPRTKASGLRHPGVSGAYASTPGHASFDLATDLDLRWFGYLNDWTPGTDMCLMARWGAATIWALVIRATTGRPRLVFTDSGVVLRTFDATAAPVVSDGALLGIRATIDANNGSGGSTVSFYTSTDPLADGTILGSAVTIATTSGAIRQSSTIAIEVGSLSVGSGQLLNGQTRQAQVRDGIGGAVVASPDFAAQKQHTRKFNDAQARPWSVNGGAVLL